MSKLARLLATTALLVVIVGLSAASAATLFSDNFSTGIGPQWVTDTWIWNSGTWLGFEGNAYSTDVDGSMSVDFGDTEANTPVEVRLKVWQSDQAVGYFIFLFGLKNSGTGLSYVEHASPYYRYFGGTSGFSQYEPGLGTHGGLADASLSINNNWDFLKFIFTPGVGVELWQAVVPLANYSTPYDAVQYTKVAGWSDYQNIASMDTFFMERTVVGRWQVKDVEIYGTASIAPTADTPTFSPDGGGSAPQSAYPMNVTISCATPGATIYYTTDGSEPSTTNGTAITSGTSIAVASCTTLRAKAVATGYNPSATKTALYQPLMFSDNFSGGLDPLWVATGAWAWTPYYSQQDACIHSYSVDGTMSVNFGSTDAGTPVEARIKVWQSDQAPGWFTFNFGLKNSATGQGYWEDACPNATSYYGGGSGFHCRDAGGGKTAGLVPGTSLSTDGNWDYLRFRFTPGVGVEVWQAKVPLANYSTPYDAAQYTKVAIWNDYQNIASMDTFFMMRENAGRWTIKDVEIYGVGAPAAAAPTFTPAGGSFTSPQDVVIDCATPDATIRYTIDGTNPTSANGTVITPGSTVLVDHDLTLKATAFASGLSQSPVTSATYCVDLFISDNWNDKTVFGPAFAPAGVDWNIENDLFNADRTVTVPGFNYWDPNAQGWGFMDPVSQALMFYPNELNWPPGARISVNFNPAVADTPVEVRLKLAETNDFPGATTFTFGLKDTVLGRYYQEDASPNGGYYFSSSGFHIMVPANLDCTEWAADQTDAPNNALAYRVGQWNYLKMNFDNSRPDGYQVEVWHAVSNDKKLNYGDPSLDYTLVAHWSDYHKLSAGQDCHMNQFYMDNDGSDMSWIVDDVEICGAFSSGPAAVATPAFTPDGGVQGSAISVAISCTTPGATIRYTTDGSIPTSATGTAITSGGSVSISNSTVLTARAFKSDLADSTSKSAHYYYPVLNRPQTIPYSDGVTVDGYLSDWADAAWAPLDQTYDGDPTDIPEAHYAAKWGANGEKLYVAVKVRDTAHFFTNSYVGWAARDAVEIYVHTTGETGNYQSNQEPAQQYEVGITSDDHAAVWSSIGAATVDLPASAGFMAAGREGTGSDEGWLFYEVALTPFEYFGGLIGRSNIPSILHGGDLIGLDVVAVSNDNLSSPGTYDIFGYTGTKAENTMGGKFHNIAMFGLHALGMPVLNVNIAGAKQLADNSGVITSGYVSAKFSGFIYIEDSERTYGIRVNTSQNPALGQNVSVTGVIKTLNSERYIDASSVSSLSGTLTIEPLGMTNKALGGDQLGLQSGVEGGTGLNNIGLLVRTTGKVGAKGSSWFMLDDGSGVSVKVYGTVPTGTPYVTVTGASSCEEDGSSKVQRVIQATAVQTVL